MPTSFICRWKALGPALAPEWGAESGPASGQLWAPVVRKRLRPQPLKRPHRLVGSRRASRSVH
jgi:hypothetical protein